MSEYKIQILPIGQCLLGGIKITLRRERDYSKPKVSRELTFSRIDYSFCSFSREVELARHGNEEVPGRTWKKIG